MHSDTSSPSSWMPLWRAMLLHGMIQSLLFSTTLFLLIESSLSNQWSQPMDFLFIVSSLGCSYLLGQTLGSRYFGSYSQSHVLRFFALSQLPQLPILFWQVYHFSTLSFVWAMLYANMTAFLTGCSVPMKYQLDTHFAQFLPLVEMLSRRYFMALTGAAVGFIVVLSRWDLALFGVSMLVLMGVLAIIFYIVDASFPFTSPIYPSSPDHDSVNWHNVNRQAWADAMTHPRLLQLMVLQGWGQLVILGLFYYLGIHLYHPNTTVVAWLTVVGDIVFGTAIGCLLAIRAFSTAFHLRFTPFILIVGAFVLQHLAITSPMDALTQTALYDWAAFLFSVSAIYQMHVVTLSAVVAFFMQSVNGCIARTLGKTSSGVTANIVEYGQLLLQIVTLSALFSLHYAADLSIAAILSAIAVASLVTALIWLYYNPYNPVLQIIRLSMSIYFQWVHRLEVQGKHHLEAIEARRAVIISNHSSWYDVPVIGSLFPFPLVYPITAAIANNPLIRFATSCAGGCIFPINQKNPRQLIELCKAIKPGSPCLIFPEGRLSTTGNLLKLFEGTAVIAEKSKADIIPMFIHGGHSAKGLSYDDGRYAKRWLPQLSLSIGKPLPFAAWSHLQGRALREAIMHDMFHALLKTAFGGRARHNLVEALYHSAYTFGSHKVILDEDHHHRRISYFQLITQARLLGAYIRKHCGNDSSPVALMMPSGCDAVIALFALWFAERSVALLDPHHNSETLQRCLTLCGAKQLIYCNSLAKHPLLVNAAAVAPHIALHDYADCHCHATARRRKAWLTVRPQRFYGTSCHKLRQPAVVLFTNPQHTNAKGLVFTHSQVLANCTQYALLSDLGNNDVVYNALQLSDPLGLFAGLLSPLLNGIHTYMHDPALVPANILANVYMNQCHALVCDQDQLLQTYDHVDKYESYRLRVCFVREQFYNREQLLNWGRQAKAMMLSVYIPSDLGSIVAMNTPYVSIPSGSQGLISQQTQLQHGAMIPGLDHSVTTLQSPLLHGYVYQPTQPGQCTAVDACLLIDDILDVDDQKIIHYRGNRHQLVNMNGQSITAHTLCSALHNLYPHAHFRVFSLNDHSVSANQHGIWVICDDDTLSIHMLQTQWAKTPAALQPFCPQHLYIDKHLIQQPYTSYPAKLLAMLSELSSPEDAS